MKIAALGVFAFALSFFAVSAVHGQTSTPTPTGTSTPTATPTPRTTTPTPTGTVPSGPPATGFGGGY